MKKLPVLTIVAILVIASGAYIYYRGKQSQSSSPPANIEVDSIWKNYEDKDLGVSFKYPSGLGGPSKILLSTRLEVVIAREERPRLEVGSGVFYNQELGRNMTLKEVATPLPYQDFKPTTINGKSAIILSGASTGIKENTAYIQGNGDTIITIDYVYNSEDPNGENIFNKILASVEIK